MARKPKYTEAVETVAEAVAANINVMIMCGNMWMKDVKWLQYDVVEMTSEEADIACKNNRAKATKDDATHGKDPEGNRVAL